MKLHFQAVLSCNSWFCPKMHYSAINIYCTDTNEWIAIFDEDTNLSSNLSQKNELFIIKNTTSLYKKAFEFVAFRLKNNRRWDDIKPDESVDGEICIMHRSPAAELVDGRLLILYSSPDDWHSYENYKIKRIKCSE